MPRTWLGEYLFGSEQVDTVQAFRMAKRARSNTTKASSAASRSSKRRRVNYRPSASLVEIKSVDSVLSSYFASDNLQASLVNAPVEGTDRFNRIGRRIVMKSLHVKGIIAPIRTLTYPEYLTMWVIYDRQSQGSLPSIGTVLQDITNAGTTVTGAYSSLNMDNKQRFKIVRKQSWYGPNMAYSGGTVTNVGIESQPNGSWAVDMFIPLKDLTTEFNNTSGGSIADINTGAIFVLTTGRAASVSATHQFDGYARLRFHD